MKSKLQKASLHNQKKKKKVTLKLYIKLYSLTAYRHEFRGNVQQGTLLSF